MSLDISVEEITPQQAAAILEKNVGNRNVRKSRVETYARDMKAHAWRLNGEPLRFNGNGKLIDGQHRLLACVLAQTSFQTVVARGLKEVDHATIDTGLKRTLADELRWMGEKHVGELAAVLSLVWGYDNGATWHHQGSRNDLLTLLKKQGEIRESLKAIAVGRKTGIRPTAIAAAHYLIAREHDAEAADEFLSSIESGTGYDEGDPCLALRTYAATTASSRMVRPGTIDWFAVCIKAANAWLLGRPVKQLYWRRVGRMKEQFPQIVSRTDVESGFTKSVQTGRDPKA